MFNWLFRKKTGSRLGIDLGNFAIKIVELDKEGERLHLKNYALAQTKDESSDFVISEIKESEVGAILKALMAESKIQSRLANISLPVGMTFSTVVDMPPMAAQELVAAIPFEAQKYVPVPLDEVVLDWSVIPSDKNGKTANGNSAAAQPGAVQTNSSGSNLVPFQVLIVAVPKEIVERLSRIAKIAGLEITSLEQESFSMARALVGNDQSTFLIVDLGRKSTDLIISDQALVKMSHNIDTIDKQIIFTEIERVTNDFKNRYGRAVSQCLLTGGRNNDAGLVNFLSSQLKIPVKPGEPFARISYSAVLKPSIRELGSLLTVAIGLAMREN